MVDKIVGHRAINLPVKAPSPNIGLQYQEQLSPLACRVLRTCRSRANRYSSSQLPLFVANRAETPLPLGCAEPQYGNLL